MKSAPFTLGLVAAAQAASLPENFQRTRNVASEVLTGCRSDLHGRFEISVAPNDNSRRTSYCGTDDKALVITLTNGVLKDAKGRTGYIASNHQFQFDAPPQYNALRSSGFAICDNRVLALGNSKVFWECLADKFYNLYDAKIAPQCRPVTITAWPCDGPECPEGGYPNKPPLVWEIPDGQIQAPWTDPHGPGKDGPGKDGPGKDGPGKDGPGKDGPGKDGPSKDGPSKDGPSKDGPGKAQGSSKPAR